MIIEFGVVLGVSRVFIFIVLENGLKARTKEQDNANFNGPVPCANTYSLVKLLSIIVSVVNKKIPSSTDTDCPILVGSIVVKKEEPIVPILAIYYVILDHVLPVHFREIK
jgi:hypothetical protein